MTGGLGKIIGAGAGAHISEEASPMVSGMASEAGAQMGEAGGNTMVYYTRKALEAEGGEAALVGFGVPFIAGVSMMAGGGIAATGNVLGGVATGATTAYKGTKVLTDCLGSFEDEKLAKMKHKSTVQRLQQAQEGANDASNAVKEVQAKIQDNSQRSAKRLGHIADKVDQTSNALDVAHTEQNRNTTVGAVVGAVSGAAIYHLTKRNDDNNEDSNNPEAVISAQNQDTQSSGGLIPAITGLDATSYHSSGGNNNNIGSEEIIVADVEISDHILLPPTPALESISDNERRDLEVFNEPDPSRLSSSDREKYHALKAKYETTRNKDELFDIAFALHDMAKDNR